MTVSTAGSFQNRLVAALTLLITYNLPLKLSLSPCNRALKWWGPATMSSQHWYKVKVYPHRDRNTGTGTWIIKHSARQWHQHLGDVLSTKTLIILNAFQISVWISCSPDALPLCSFQTSTVCRLKLSSQTVLVFKPLPDLMSSPVPGSLSMTTLKR